MAADVGYMVCAIGDSRRTRRFNESNKSEPRTQLITKDLLGESFSDISNDSYHELDVHLQVTTGWPENCLDLVESGKGHLQKCSRSQPNRPANKRIKRPLESSNEEMKWSTNIYSSTYKSVCTLDKVKAALNREKRDQFVRRKLYMPTSSSNSLSSSSIVTNEVTLNLETTSMPMPSPSSQHGGSLKLSAAGCSNCLMYVMISNESHKCPKCDLTVSLPVSKKKPRIDLDLNLYL